MSGPAPRTEASAASERPPASGEPTDDWRANYFALAAVCQKVADDLRDELAALRAAPLADERLRADFIALHAKLVHGCEHEYQDLDLAALRGET